MADDKELSIEEILAAARAADGGSSGKPKGDAGGDAPPPSGDAPKAKPKPAAPAAGGSVADILAAARASDGGGGGSEEEAPAPAAPKKPAASPPAGGSVEDILAAARASDSGEAPKAKPKAAPAGGGGGIEDILAAARAADGGGAAPKPKATPAAGGAKPAAGAAKPKPAPASPTAAVEAETSSILAAARGGTARKGPVSRSEAAQSGAAAAPRPAKPAATVPPMPEKPGYAMPPAAAAAEPTRRGFLDYALGSSLAIGFSSLTLVNLLWLLGLARFMFPNILTEPPTRFKVGVPDDFAPGQVQEKYKAEFGVWVVRYEYEGTPMIYALSTVCTHLGCTPNWLEGEQKFKCPCHGSGFYKDGINFEGPAPRPLERYAITRADDGQLEVDKSKTFQQEKGQWRDPGSYVVV